MFLEPFFHLAYWAFYPLFDIFILDSALPRGNRDRGLTTLYLKLLSTSILRNPTQNSISCWKSESKKKYPIVERSFSKYLITMVIFYRFDKILTGLQNSKTVITPEKCRTWENCLLSQGITWTTSLLSLTQEYCPYHGQLDQRTINSSLHFWVLLLNFCKAHSFTWFSFDLSYKRCILDSIFLCHQFIQIHCNGFRVRQHLRYPDVDTNLKKLTSQVNSSV